MYLPISLPFILLFGLLLAVLFILLEVGVIEVVHHKLGISHRMISGLLLLTIIGSYINIPVAAVAAKRLIENQIVVVYGIPYVVPQVQEVGRTVIAINVGGALIPLLLSLYLLFRLRVMLPALVATAFVSFVVYRFSRLVPGVGIAVPTLVPGVLAAITASLLDYRHSAAVAYIAGTVGCLLGADIYNLGAIAQLNAPIASIGGAGTFDGVFMSGIIAVLLA